MRLFLTTTLICLFSSLCAQVQDENIFRLVNSGFDEQNPVISPDGQTLFFTISNHPQNAGGKKDPGDIWFSRWTTNQWSVPVHGGPLLNDRAYNAVAGFSGDGSQLLLHGHYDHSGNPARTQGISISNWDGATWSRPVNVSIPYFQNKSHLTCGSLSLDGNVFVFSAETYGTYGVDDLYVSLRQNGKWSEPKNLGRSVNTQFQEVAPSISADGKVIYFSSNGLKGNGSFDVYSATRLDDSWTNWSAPVNMGARVNSSGRELYFRIHPGLGYATFTSTTNSDGYGDIKLFRPDIPFPADTAVTIVQQQPADSIVKVAEAALDTASESAGEQIKVHGKIANSKTGEPVNAEVAFAAPGMPNVNTIAQSGGYEVSISASGEYTIVIEAQGYVSAMQKLTVNTSEMRTLEMNFTVQPIEVGTTVNLKNVLFAQTKTDILPESFPELDLVVHFLNQNPNVRIELAGHTDNRGIHSDNVKLSQQRVNKVKEYLVSKGIDSKRISGKGFGGTRPIASNDSEETRRMNRRVEFTIKRL